MTAQGKGLQQLLPMLLGRSSSSVPSKSPALIDLNTQPITACFMTLKVSWKWTVLQGCWDLSEAFAITGISH